MPTKPVSIVYLGESLGGYLAPRAAAFDPRIDGVASQDVFFDGGEAADKATKPLVKWLMDNNHYGILSFLVNMQHDAGAKWNQANGMWVFGVKHPWDVSTAFRRYTLRRGIQDHGRCSDPRRGTRSLRYGGSGREIQGQSHACTQRNDGCFR